MSGSANFIFCSQFRGNSCGQQTSNRSANFVFCSQFRVSYEQQTSNHKSDMKDKKMVVTFANLHSILWTMATLNWIISLCSSDLQLAALDFIACAAADAFAMTDPGSQFSSLVQGYRMYYGGGDLPTLRPNKRRLASILVKNATIEWNEFESRVRKLIQQTKQIHERPVARSIFRHPRCPECMCRTEH